MKSQTFKSEVDDGYIYDFKCEGCGGEGEIIVPKHLRRFNCPEGCGASYLHWKRSNVPTITCVVCPIFEVPEQRG
jgi:hypothetical protein